MEGIQTGLMEVLEFREEKAAVQMQMCTENPEGTVVSLGMNIPGPIKNSPSICEAFQEGKRAMLQLFSECNILIQKEAVLEQRAGYAAVWLTMGTNAEEIKRTAVTLEENHILGRIFDIDVFGKDGAALSREAVGAEKRKCLLCGRDAKECGRNRTHVVQELQAKVSEIIESWKIRGETWEKDLQQKKKQK